MRRKQIPQRTCVICRRKMDKRRLLRVVRTAEDGTVADPTGKRNGRGAYLCDEAACWDKLLNSKVLDRELRVEITEAEKNSLLSFRPQANAGE
ncbi:MAG TPA: YlxR family protein [Patescibacteria group bacterium]|nr:YlxR family protein [Patescibacteria group bacterium]